MEHRRFLILGCMAVLSACSSGANGTLPSAIQAGGSLPLARTASAPRALHVKTITTPAYSTQVLSAGNGSVYFGGTSDIVPGYYLYLKCADACGNGTPGLYRYSGGAFTTTSPRGPYFASGPYGPTCGGQPVPSQPCSFGNVSAVDAAEFSSPIWASDYAPDATFIPVSKLQWGGSGGTATTPPSPYDHDLSQSGLVLSILRAKNGQFWVGGGAPAPGIYPASLPSMCQSGGQYTCDFFSVVNGPGGNVWAMTHTYAPLSSVPTGTAFFEFSPAGSLLKTYTTSKIAIRIAGTKQAVWFTDYAGNAIGKIDANGSISEIALATPNAGPYGIAAAADGSIWFTEYNASKVGRLGSNGHVEEVGLTFQPFSIAATPPDCARPAIWVGSFGPQLAEIQ